MSPALIAALVALFAWWFSTGAILAIVKRADRGGPRSHLWAVLLALPVLVLGGALFFDTLERENSGAAYAAFLAALMVWGWVEMAFLCGIVTGPNRRPTDQLRGGWDRFARAFGAVAHHELLLLALLLAMALAAQGAANPFGFLTFAVLFGARILAKLNLFLGVPRINTDFLPSPLAHLPSHFRIRPMNRFYPVSLLLLGLAVAGLVLACRAAPTEAELVGFALLAALAALALLEHLLMVLPLPDERLWRWMLPAPHPETARDRNDD